MSQALTQMQDVEAEDDAVCSLTQCNKERGEKAERSNAGCDVLVHLSCYLAQTWVTEWSKTSVTKKNKQRIKGMKFDTTAPWCEACTRKTVALWLEDENSNGAAYASLKRIVFGMLVCG